MMVVVMMKLVQKPKENSISTKDMVTEPRRIQVSRRYEHWSTVFLLNKKIKQITVLGITCIHSYTMHTSGTGTIVHIHNYKGTKRRQWLTLWNTTAHLRNKHI